MMKRASITLMICALAGGAAVIGLARPAAETSTAAASPVAEASAQADTDTADGYDDADQAEGQDAATPAPAPAPAADAVVTIEGFAFGGTTVVQPGQAVTVQNLDSAPHTMTARNGAFDTGTIDGGGSGTLTMPSEPGSYEFFCSIHPSMVATITVQA